MKINTCVGCKTFPCTDVKHECYTVPDVEVKVEDVTILLISEAAPPDAQDYYYKGKAALFAQTTLLAFQDAGAKVSSLEDILGLGVYLTTAVKCGKTAYGIQTGTIEACSHILEQELDLFPNVRAYLLMGDVAIKAVNQIARRAGAGRVIPAGSTYKLRGQPYYFRGKRALPSYLQAGPSFFIEKVKRKMIAEDIATALSLAG
jgi:uracil-DNA glycosylase